MKGSELKLQYEQGLNSGLNKLVRRIDDVLVKMWTWEIDADYSFWVSVIDQAGMPNRLFFDIDLYLDNTIRINMWDKADLRLQEEAFDGKGLTPAATRVVHQFLFDHLSEAYNDHDRYWKT